MDLQLTIRDQSTIANCQPLLNAVSLALEALLVCPSLPAAAAHQLIASGKF